MDRTQKHHIAIWLTLLFIGLVAAPVVILSCDDSIDVSIFYDISEEEEYENLTIMFENRFQMSEIFAETSSNENAKTYSSKNYVKPTLSLIFSPPEFMV